MKKKKIGGSEKMRFLSNEEIEIRQIELSFYNIRRNKK
jgi:hypothetical protein